MFVTFILPAISGYPRRPITVRADRIISFQPKWVAIEETRLKILAEREYVQDGTFVETGPGEEGTIHVVESYDEVRCRLSVALAHGQLWDKEQR